MTDPELAAVRERLAQTFNISSWVNTGSRRLKDERKRGTRGAEGGG